MKKIALAATAAIALLSAATTASADVTWVESELDNLYGAPLKYGQVMLEDFDNPKNPNVKFTGNVVFNTPNPITNSAPPPYTGSVTPVGVPVGGVSVTVDPTDYASVQKNTFSTFSTLNGYYFTSFSFYMGSPDDYNRVIFNYLDGGQEQFDGTEIWGGSPAGNGDRTKGYRVYYDFGGSKVSSITFSTGSTDAFEFDGLAGTIAVPEPGTWALMILGFGGAGAMLRRRKMALA